MNQGTDKFEGVLQSWQQVAVKFPNIFIILGIKYQHKIKILFYFNKKQSKDNNNNNEITINLTEFHLVNRPKSGNW